MPTKKSKKTKEKEIKENMIESKNNELREIISDKDEKIKSLEGEAIYLKGLIFGKKKYEPEEDVEDFTNFDEERLKESVKAFDDNQIYLIRTILSKTSEDFENVSKDVKNLNMEIDNLYHFIEGRPWR